jgi:hypothetical protein
MASNKIRSGLIRFRRRIFDGAGTPLAAFADKFPHGYPFLLADLHCTIRSNTHKPV